MKQIILLVLIQVYLQLISVQGDCLSDQNCFSTHKGCRSTCSTTHCSNLSCVGGLEAYLNEIADNISCLWMIANDGYLDKASLNDQQITPSYLNEDKKCVQNKLLIEWSSNADLVSMSNCILTCISTMETRISGDFDGEEEYDEEKNNPQFEYPALSYGDLFLCNDICLQNFCSDWGCIQGGDTSYINTIKTNDDCQSLIDTDTSVKNNNKYKDIITDDYFRKYYHCLDDKVKISYSSNNQMMDSANCWHKCSDQVLNYIIQYGEESNKKQTTDCSGGKCFKNLYDCTDSCTSDNCQNMSCVNGGEAAYLSEVSDNKDCYIMTKFDNYLKSLETNDWKKKIPDYYSEIYYYCLENKLLKTWTSNSDFQSTVKCWKKCGQDHNKFYSPKPKDKGDKCKNDDCYFDLYSCTHDCFDKNCGEWENCLQGGKDKYTEVIEEHNSCKYIIIEDGKIIDTDKEFQQIDDEYIKHFETCVEDKIIPYWHDNDKIQKVGKCWEKCGDQLLNALDEKTGKGKILLVSLTVLLMFFISLI